MPMQVYQVRGTYAQMISTESLPTILRILSHRTTWRAKGEESGQFHPIMQLAARVRPRLYDAQTTEHSHPSVGSQRVGSRTDQFQSLYYSYPIDRRRHLSWPSP